MGPSVVFLPPHAGVRTEAGAGLAVVVSGTAFSLTARPLPQPDQEVVTVPDLGSLSSPLMDTERNLGLLLGLHASYLALSTPLSPVEVECASKHTSLAAVSAEPVCGRWWRWRALLSSEPCVRGEDGASVLPVGLGGCFGSTVVAFVRSPRPHGRAGPAGAPLLLPPPARVLGPVHAVCCGVWLWRLPGWTEPPALAALREPPRVGRRGAGCG